MVGAARVVQPVTTWDVLEAAKGQLAHTGNELFGDQGGHTFGRSRTRINNRVRQVRRAPVGSAEGLDRPKCSA
jgi:hypothetical protein